MRFILNFFLFGFLFYLIYIFFPEAFQTLSSWAAHVYDYCRQLVQYVMDKVGSGKTATPPVETHKAAAIFLRYWIGM